MENCEVKLFIAVLEKLPPSCRLYVGGGIDSAWKDGFLQELRRYESSMDATFDREYNYCILLSSECVSYLIRELSINEEFIYYFCHYAIVHNDCMLLKVYDTSIFSIHKRLGISDDLINMCEDNSIIVYVEDPIS